MQPSFESQAMRRWFAWVWLYVVFLLAGYAGPDHQKHPELASWTDGPSRTAIVAFVKAVNDPGSPDFVPAEDRIAVFDNDGTLWSEKPIYFQVMFSLDEVHALAPSHPDWYTRQPFMAVLQGDQAAVAKSGERGLMEIVFATNTACLWTSTRSASTTGWKPHAMRALSPVAATVHAARACMPPRNLAEETEAPSWGVRGPTNLRYRWILLKNSISARHRTKIENPLFRSA